MYRASLAVVAAFAVVGASLLTNAPEQPVPRPGQAILRDAVKRTLNQGFNFVETKTREPAVGRIESGTWQPPDAARRRIYWDTAGDDEPFTEVARIGVDSYSRAGESGQWSHSRNRFELWPVILLREIEEASVRFVNGRYEALTGRRGVTAVVRHGYVVALSDPAGYSYVLNAFGECRQISRPTEASEWMRPSPDFSNLPPEVADALRRSDSEERQRLDEEPLGPQRFC